MAMDTEICDPRIMASEFVDREHHKSSSTRASDEDEDHLNLNLSFIIAVDKPKKDPPFRETIRDGHCKRIYDWLPPSRYFHISYQLLPRENHRKRKTYNTDLVTFGNVVSKVYTDSDTRVVQGWSEKGKEEGDGDRGGGGKGKMEGRVDTNNFAWRHRHRFTISKSLLLELHHNILEVRLWTAMNKISPRASYDRPKAFRISVPDNGGHGDGLTIGLSRKPSKFPEVSHYAQEGNIRGQNTRRKYSTAVSNDGSIQTVHSDESNASPNALTIKISKYEHKASDFKRRQSKSLHLPITPTTSARKQQLEAAEKARIDQEGLVVLKLKLSELFMRQGCIGTKMVGDNVGQGLRGFEVTVSTSPIPQDLMRELKPMIITIEKVSGLPNTPLSHEEIQEKCKPTYVQYQFPTKPKCRTPGLPHAPSLTFNSSNIIFLGVIDPSVLIEYLRGPPLIFEVHDRDSVPKSKGSEAVFGREPQDDMIGTHAFSSDLRHLALLRKEESNSRTIPYGSAVFDLGNLLSDRTTLTLSLPVVRGPWVTDRVATLDSSMGNVQFNKIPPGDYIESGCEVLVTIDLYYPLDLLNTKASFVKAKSQRRITKWKTIVKKSSTVYPHTSCSFNRLIYIISSGGSSLIEKLLMKINRINSKTLGLDSLAPKVLQAALSTYKLTREQLSSGQENLITGFHVEDWSQHIIILEGLKEGGVKTLWEEFPHHHSQEATIKKIFYNSDFSFSKRLYGTLDVDLPKIKLYRPLKEIVQQTLIYVHGCVPTASFRGLMCLNELELVKEMADITRNNLFPTPEEVAALSLQFSIPATIESETSNSMATQEDQNHTPLRPKTPYVVSHRSKFIHIPLDTTNPVFSDFIKKRRTSSLKDYIQSNISNCKTLSDLQKPHSHIHHRSQSERSSLSVVHNYSSQTYNSMRHALARLREGLDPNKLYTFCQDYNSATVVPVDMEAEERSQRLHSRKLWRSKEGFIYPGVPSSLQCNAHPMRPDTARIKEISEPFEDNLHHTEIERTDLDRNLDFDLLTAPPHDSSYPKSVHPVGDARTRELEEERKKNYENWREKVVVDDVQFHIYRGNINTELSTKASSRLQSLQGLLKDSPQKLSLKKEGFKLAEISPLGVVQCPSLDRTLNFLTVKERGERENPCCRGYQPGPWEDHSLMKSGNQIPILGDPPKDPDSPFHPQPFRLYESSTPLSYQPTRPLTAKSPQSLPVFVSQPESSGTSQQHQQLEQTPA